MEIKIIADEFGRNKLILNIGIPLYELLGEGWCLNIKKDTFKICWIPKPVRCDKLIRLEIIKLPNRNKAFYYYYKITYIEDENAFTRCNEVEDEDLSIKCLDIIHCWSSSIYEGAGLDCALEKYILQCFIEKLDRWYLRDVQLYKKINNYILHGRTQSFPYLLTKKCS